MAGEDEGSGHSFIALSCPTKYLLGEARLLLPPPRELQVVHDSVWLMGYHHEVSRMKHTSPIYLRNTLFRHPNDFHPALDPKPEEDICNKKRAVGVPALFYSFPLLVCERKMHLSAHSQSQVTCSPSFSGICHFPSAHFQKN